MLKRTISSMNYITASATLFSKKVDLWAQQTRNTFILKRKLPINLYKKNQRPQRFKAKNYIYELVENTNCRKDKEISLILLEDVDSFGKKGRVIDVPARKAYNNLLLPQLAVYATPENIERYVDKSVEEEDNKELNAPSVQRTLNILSSLYLSVLMSKDIPWTLEKWHVRASFRKAGIHIPDEAITMPKKAICGPDLSIDNKEFYVTITINNCDQVKVRCRIHHYLSHQQDITKNLPKPWEIPSEAIFPEDQVILDSLPKHRLLLKPKANIS